MADAHTNSFYFLMPYVSYRAKKQKATSSRSPALNVLAVAQFLPAGAAARSLGAGSEDTGRCDGEDTWLLGQMWRFCDPPPGSQVPHGGRQLTAGTSANTILAFPGRKSPKTWLSDVPGLMAEATLFLPTNSFSAYPS